MPSSSTTTRIRCLALLLLGLLPSPLVAETPPGREVRIVYVDRQGDPHYVPKAGYAGLFRRELLSPFPAAELGIRDVRIIGQAIGVTFTLERKTIAADADAVSAVRGLAQDAAAVILDLPLGDVTTVAKALAAEPVALINARHLDEALRSSTCRTGLFHTMPSLPMLMDGLAQALVSWNWKRVLVLEGAQAADRALSSAFRASALKFGVRIEDVRPFVSGNDPRKRDQINVRLLTAGADYDAVFVADAEGEFARYVPFNTARPRPVIGSTGLVARAWHPYWERHGAPQLNRRFARAQERPMSDEDWAAWVAVRAIVEAVVAMEPRDGASRGLREALTSRTLAVELYKGVPGSFRSWSRQLRQPILIGTADAVIARAPADGVLHRTNNLDTLGADEPEFRCLE